ncbi:MAG: hypothetical protein CMN30_30815 [Sandaracinus sp.]|nr:hypothetical protein [Sandaracinus sp.]
MVACGDDGRTRPGRDMGPVVTPDMGDPVDMRMTPTGCTPGATACAGNTFYTCGDDGVSQVNPMVCEGACDTVEGCVACTPGQRRCDGTVSMVCAPDASGFVTARDCAESGVACGTNGYCNDACGNAEANKSNIGCEYWPVPLANLGGFTTDYDFRVVVANPDDSPASVQVFRGDSVVAEATVAPGGLDDIVLPWVSGMSDGINATTPGSVSTTNGAYRLVSDRPVTVAQFNPFEYDSSSAADFSYTNDASLLLPSHSYTGEYITSSYIPLSRTLVDPGFPPVIPPSSDSSSSPGYIAVVGITPEPTTVNIGLSAPVAADRNGKFPATSAGNTISFTVQRGEVVHVVAAAPPACSAARPGFTVEDIGGGTELQFCNETQYDLTGSRVQANHPVEVFGGHVCAYVPYSAQACDHLENQMPPLQTWGTEYVSAPMGDTSAAARNIVRVVAAFDGTTVTVEPAQGGVTGGPLSAGGWLEFEATTPFRVTGSRGVMVTQYLVGQQATTPAADRGDPAMIVLPPEEQFRSDYTFATPTSYNSSTSGQSYLLIVREPGLAITLDGSPVTATFSSVGGREVATVPVEGGTHTMEAERGFGVFVFGMGQYTSYAYPAGLDLEEILLI